MKSYRVAVVGAMGAVGQEMIKMLEHSTLNISHLKLLDIDQNVGKSLTFGNKTLSVEESKAGQFRDVDLALFAAGAKASEMLAPIAVSEGAVVIDNSSFYRMHQDVPLVVPEVNPEALRNHRGLIANPNCSTTQMVVALKPLHDRYRIKRVVVSTYQAVSGSGMAGIRELQEQQEALSAGEEVKVQTYPHQIANNALPQIDLFLENGYTKEEMKMVDETRKILSAEIAVSPTAVRIPVFRGHSEALNVELATSFELEELKALYEKSEGIVLLDDPATSTYPLATSAAGRKEVFVGRIRRDLTLEHGVNLWVVADNLLKGAALNAVQIAEKMAELDVITSPVKD